jgi:hypothetical protein
LYIYIYIFFFIVFVFHKSLTSSLFITFILLDKGIDSIFIDKNRAKTFSAVAMGTTLL